MRFISVVSMAMALVAPATAFHDDSYHLAERDYAPSRGYGGDVYARHVYDDDDLYTRGLFKRAKAKLMIPKKLTHGSLTQREAPQVAEFGEAAMLEAGFNKGTVSAGWHDGLTTSSQDPLKHFDITPTPGSGDGANNGIMHVYTNGAWSQGPKGRIRGKKDPPVATPPPSPTKAKPAPPKANPAPKKPAPKKGKRSYMARKAWLAKRAQRDIPSYYYY